LGRKHKTGMSVPVAHRHRRLLPSVAFACLVVRCLLCVLGVHSTKGLKMIKRGDRVKLTVRVAAAFNNSKRTHKFDWTDRRGVVERITANKAAAMVLWDGRKSVDDVRSVVLNWNQQSWDSSL
jgi:hypothetical protein